MTAPVAAPVTVAAQQQAVGGLTAAQLAQLVALVEAQAAVRAQLTRTATTAAATALHGFDGWWDAAEVGRVIQQILRVVQPAQRQAARVTDAFVARVATLMTGRPVRPVGAIDVTKVRRSIPPDVLKKLAAGKLIPPRIVLGDTVDGPGKTVDAPYRPVIPDSTAAVDPAAVYARAFEIYRYQIVAQGVPQEQAARTALVRIQAAAEHDVTLAVRDMYQKALGPIKGIVGYRRILHPERSEHGPCGLCAVAADRVYKKAELLPLHERCKCEVLPIIGDLDPGTSLNRDDLERIYAAAGGTGGEIIKGGKRHSGALKRIRVALAEHGETGPVLIDDGHHFRGPAEVAKATVPDRATRARAQLTSLEKSFATLLERQTHGEKLDKPIAWQQNKIDELRRELHLTS